MRLFFLTSRLTLRPLTPQDLIPLQMLADDRAIADTMISVPHPFTLAHAGMYRQADGGSDAAGNGEGAPPVCPQAKRPPECSAVVVE